MYNVVEDNYLSCQLVIKARTLSKTRELMIIVLEILLVCIG